VQGVYIRSQNDLRRALGDQPVFDLITFEGGNEAATANYEDGKLLIVEFSTPQFSIDTDNRVKQFFAKTRRPRRFIFAASGITKFLFSMRAANLPPMN
jgi:hypothetical protein